MSAVSSHSKKSFLRRIVKEWFEHHRAQPTLLKEWSHTLVKHLEAHITQHAFTRIAAFWPLESEPQIQSLISEGLSRNISFYLPRISNKTEGKMDFFAIQNTDELIPGSLGILEPKATHPTPIHEMDLILVPGVQFDLAGHRLGRGRGFYDRILSQENHPKGSFPTTIGITFSAHVVKELTCIEKHDCRVDFLCTENGVIQKEFKSHVD